MDGGSLGDNVCGEGGRGLSAGWMDEEEGREGGMEGGREGGMEGGRRKEEGLTYLDQH